MKHNLLELYQQTDGFNKLPGSRLLNTVSTLTRLMAASLQIQTPVHWDRRDEGKIRVYEDMGRYTLLAYRQNGTLEEEQELELNGTKPHALNVICYDETGKKPRTKELYGVSEESPPALYLRKYRSHTSGGAEEDVTIDYAPPAEGSSQVVPEKETKFFAGTENTREITQFDENGGMRERAYYDEAGTPIIHEEYYPDSGTLRLLRRYVDGKAAEEHYYRRDRSLEWHVDQSDPDRRIVKAFAEDGTTLVSSWEYRGDTPQNTIDYYPTDPPCPKVKLLLRGDGSAGNEQFKAYKAIYYTRDGKISGQASFDADTGNRTDEWHVHPQTGDIDEYTYNPLKEVLRTHVSRRAPYPGQREGTTSRTEHFHDDGETLRRSIQHDDDGTPTLETANFRSGKPKYTLDYDDAGHPKSKVVHAEDSGRIIYEASYAPGSEGKRKTSESLHFSPDPDIENIERKFYESGRLQQEIATHHNGKTSELSYYDQSPQQVSEELLVGTTGDIEVRRYYDKGGHRLANPITDINPDSEWKNRLEMQKEKRVFGKPSHALLTEVDSGFHYEGDVRIFSGEVSLLLQGGTEELQNAKRKIEAKIPGVHAELQTREQVIDQRGDYFGRKDWVSTKTEHITHGIPRQEVSVLKVTLPYDQDREWPKRHNVMYTADDYDAITADNERAREVLTELTKQVHTYTHCDLGVRVKPSHVQRHGRFTPHVQITAEIEGSSPPGMLRQRVVMEVVKQKLQDRLPNVEVGSSPVGSASVVYLQGEELRANVEGAEEKTRLRAEEMAKQVSDMLNFRPDSGRAAAREA